MATQLGLFCLLLPLFSLVVFGSEEEMPGVPELVTYETFGAKGDGKADDQEAIAKAHAYANEKHLPVRVKDGATYYIGNGDTRIIIQTDTDFGTATFTIDDRDLGDNRGHVFVVEGDKECTSLVGITTLRKGQTRIAATFDEPCLVQVYNSNVKQFIRKGNNQNSGSAQQDIFIVDEQGTIDKSTPVIWDFDVITRSTVIPVDDNPIELKGGTFVTLPSHEHSSKYHGRGIGINRSNVTIKGVKHLIRNPGKDGAPYHSFLGISGCANVVVVDCVFTGRTTYYKIGSAGRRVSMGSYELGVSSAVNIRFVNCSQSNDISDSRYWGVMGSNHAKNIEYNRCRLSRFDAHQGVTNARILNSVLGRQGINAIGHGHLLVENTEVRNRSFINFRSDYGSTWNGDVTIRNCVLAPPRRGDISIFNGRNEGDHDFGYTCYMPTNILIDGLKIRDNPNEEITRVYLFSDYSTNFKKPDQKEKYPIVRARQVVLRNVGTESGQPIKLSRNGYFFNGVDVLREN